MLLGKQALLIDHPHRVGVIMKGGGVGGGLRLGGWLLSLLVIAVCVLMYLVTNEGYFNLWSATPHLPKLVMFVSKLVGHNHQPNVLPEVAWSTANSWMAALLASSLLFGCSRDKYNRAFLWWQYCHFMTFRTTRSDLLSTLVLRGALGEVRLRVDKYTYEEASVLLWCGLPTLTLLVF